MAERTKPTSSGGNPDKTNGTTISSAHTDEERRALTRAKMTLVAALETKSGTVDGGTRGDGALVRVLGEHPQHADELTDFYAALVAVPLLPEALPTAETELIAERAYTRAFAAVFPVAPVAAQAPAIAVVALKELRTACGLKMTVVAARLGLGVDVLSTLEQGRVAASSIPERLTRMLGEALGVAAEQVRAALDAQGPMMPAFQRSKSGATKDGQGAALVDFAELVRQSPNMSDDAKTTWLTPSSEEGAGA